MALEQKLQNLQNILLQYHSAVIAFSGGVDSSLLFKVAVKVLGENVLAVTADSETYPSFELAQAKELAQTINGRLEIIQTAELANPVYAQNPPNRCYYCKQELFGKLLALAQERGYAYVLDGANADDGGDYRPGLQAGKELGIKSPLKEAGLTKADIRTLARQMGLSNWDKPSFACLSSRFPYGQAITAQKLHQVAEAEALLRNLAFRQFRVRHHGEIARIEVDVDALTKLVEPTTRQTIVEALQTLGFAYVTIDLAGFRSGSMNEVLPEEVKDGFK